MMEFSTYEAKARFSEVLRLVREGHPVTITYRGTPVAEIRPIDDSGASPLEARVRELERHGEVVTVDRKGERGVFQRKPGALQRFLEERDR